MSSTVTLTKWYEKGKLVRQEAVASEESEMVRIEAVRFRRFNPFTKKLEDVN